MKEISLLYIWHGTTAFLSKTKSSYIYRQHKDICKSLQILIESLVLLLNYLQLLFSLLLLTVNVQFSVQITEMMLQCQLLFIYPLIYMNIIKIHLFLSGKGLILVSLSLSLTLTQLKLSLCLNYTTVLTVSVHMCVCVCCYTNSTCMCYESREKERGRDKRMQVTPQPYRFVHSDLITNLYMPRC